MMKKLILTTSSGDGFNVVTSLLMKLRPLPEIVRYYDDFDDKLRTIENFASSDLIGYSGPHCPDIISLNLRGYRFRYSGLALSHFFF